MGRCLTHDSEVRALLDDEAGITLRAFMSAHRGVDVYPVGGLYTIGQRQAWETGKQAYKSRVFPWALERRFYRDNDPENGIERAKTDQDNFKLTGKLPESLEKFLDTFYTR